MTYAIRCLIVASIFGPALAVAQSFEGKITSVLSAGGMQIELEQHLRGNMLRQDMSMAGTSVSIITNRESGKAIMVNHPQKMWMDMATMNRMMARKGPGADDAREGPNEMPPIERTDRVETIAGHECRHFVINSSSGKVDLCAATGMGVVLPGGAPGMGGMGPSDGPGMPALPAAEVWARAFRDGFFVLKMEAATAQGDVTWVAKSVERKAVSEAVFAPPAGYMEMKMPGGR